MRKTGQFLDQHTKIRPALRLLVQELDGNRNAGAPLFGLALTRSFRFAILVAQDRFT